MAAGHGHDHSHPPAAIKNWPEDERPREKLIRHGAAALSDSELIAILIGKGSRSASAVDLAKSILREYSSLQRLPSLTVADLKQSKFKGIGPVKAVTLVAAFEIARRLAKQPADTSASIRSPEDIARRFIPDLRDKKQEEFLVVCLSSANKIISSRTVTRGLLNSSLTHPREVFREAILEQAASIILLHNHPSGNREPSREDIAITRQLVEAGKIIGIEVHDHIIIAGDGYTSLMERGLM